MADATFTTVVARVDQQLTNAIWEDQIRDNLNQLAGAHRNLVTNGGFERWQRGAGSFVFTSLNQGYTSDRWNASSGSGTTSTITQETSIVATDSASSLKFVTSGGTATLQQNIENYQELRGRTISFSCQVRQGTAAAVALSISDGGGGTTGSTSATTGSFVTLTVTRTMSTTATQASVSLGIASGATVYFDNAMVVIGPDPAPFQPLHPQEDLARCQRYYEVHGGVNTSMSFFGYGAAAGGVGQIVSFCTTKAGTPTMTKNGTWAVVNCGQPSTSSPSVSEYSLSAVVTALGSAQFNANSADDTITAEFNP